MNIETEAELIGEEEGKSKKLITWKDADQNLCRLICEMLDDLDFIRSDTGGGNTQSKAFPTETPGTSIPPGHLDSNNTHRGWWTVGWNEEEVDIHPAPVDNTDYGHPISACCWYSFNNLCRMRLKQARMELVKNLFGQSKGKKKDAGATRNAKPKPRNVSKYNRASERPQ